MTTALAVTLGLPAMALIQPDSKPLTQAIASAVPDPASGSKVAAASAGAIARESAVSADYLPDPHLRERQTAATTLAAKVQKLSDEADSVDRLWQAFSEQCGGGPKAAQASFGRDWFPILNGGATVALGQRDPQFARSPYCVELIQLIRQSGDGIRRDLRNALASARRARVDPGTEVGLLRWHSLELP